MRVLVAVASRHGSTAEVAERIGRVLTAHGLEVEVAPVENVHDIDSYDAIVLGSAVYMGHWIASARKFVRKWWSELQDRPVWLFSSGPVGEPMRADGQLPDVDQISQTIGTLDHRMFAGKLAVSSLTVPEKAMVRLMHQPDGDFRNWQAIETWATGIAEACSAVQRGEASSAAVD